MRISRYVLKFINRQVEPDKQKDRQRDRMTDKPSDRQRYREKIHNNQTEAYIDRYNIERQIELTYIDRQTTRCMDGWLEI